jgi:eukaryotic-like serine/threonine-protein kinase
VSVLKRGEVVGPYVVIAHAGAGGMGEVYQARDTRLNRLVALKVIGTDDDHRGELARRFAAEAKAIAALSHPHICTIHDVGHHDGRNYLVLEYLEGEVLAERLKRGPLTAKELVQYAIEMADALEFAHRHGVVHRDLKPSNVFLCRGAGTKLLDFGLARMREAAARPDALSSLATEPVEITSESAIVGTLAYMAPERLDGRVADARSDIFGYGAILYEMLTGRKAFAENTQARLIAAILTSDPPPAQPRADIPSALEWIARDCLAKDPNDRWQSMADVARVLRNLAHPSLGTAPRTTAHDWRWKAAAGLLPLAALTGLVAWLLVGSPNDLERVDPVVLAIPPPTGQAFAMTESTVPSAQFAVAPDGKTIVFVGRSEGEPQLWIRELGRPEARSVPETAGASYPFWSPDNLFIGFFANGTLKKVGLTGRSPQPLCKAPNGRGGTWQDGTIVFSPDTSSGLLKVSDGGGTPEPLTRGDSRRSHRWPQFLPGGDLLFFVKSGDADVQGIYATSLATPQDIRQVRRNSSSGTYASGKLLYVLEGSLVSQVFDARTWALSGEAHPLGLRAAVSSASNPALSASRDGVLATWSNAGSLSQLVWYDRHAQRLGVAGPPDRYVDFRLSPDEQRLAVSRVDPTTASADVGVLDLQRNGSLTMVSTSPQTDAAPIWSPDGKRLVFRSNRRGLHDLFERPADGGGEDQLLNGPGEGVYPTDWSSDGTILFHQLSQSPKHDIWKLDPARARVEPLVQTPWDEVQAQVAGGGRLAYMSDQSGAMNVFVRSINDARGLTNVSVNGGFDPRWRADGRELFYISSDGTLMSAELAAENPPRVVGTKPLFKTSIQQSAAPYLSRYIVTKDGTRFLINEELEPPGSVPITVTLHWPALVARVR